MENSKATKEAIKAVIEKLKNMSNEEFRKEMEKTESGAGQILLDGGFLDNHRKDHEEN